MKIVCVSHVLKKYYWLIYHYQIFITPKYQCHYLPQTSSVGQVIVLLYTTEIIMMSRMRIETSPSSVNLAQVSKKACKSLQIN